jgi:hypothetical protein
MKLVARVAAEKMGSGVTDTSRPAALSRSTTASNAGKLPLKVTSKTVGKAWREACTCTRANALQLSGNMNGGRHRLS